VSVKTIKASDRRVHPRIDTAELPVTPHVSISNRPGISLVDLSSGGALLELPFPLRPEARVTLAVSTPDENLALPFQLLRCYVSGVNGGVRYHAAGAFDQMLTLASLTLGVPPTPLERLVNALEAFLRSTQDTSLTSTGANFHQLIGWVIASLRRGDPARLIAIKIKAHLAQQFPSLVILPESDRYTRDARTSARFFGYDFRSNEVLTRSDRRVLRAGAQMIALLERHAREEAAAGSSSSDRPNHPPKMIIHSLGEWQQYRQTA
jgi:hypothetical protein